MADDARPFLPGRKTLASLKRASQECRGCELYKRGTQTVFGEGTSRAQVVFVGEQPGDREDREGHPFVGPAGSILDRALAEAGIDRREVYVTNAVKHFKWVPQGKRRLHQKPRVSEIKACFPWLEEELRILRPAVVVCLGATAAHAVFGRALPVLSNRGKWKESAWTPHTLITVHPSSLLRMRGEDERDRAFREWVREFRLVRDKMKG